jgi:hypothetical protein
MKSFLFKSKWDDANSDNNRSSTSISFINIGANSK